LVGFYPANKLIVRRLLSRRIAALALGHHAVLAVVSHSCPPPGDRYLRVTHPSATDQGCPQSVRLACVKHAASVRSEPGSNSQVHHAPRFRRTKTNKPCLFSQAFSSRCGAPETNLTSVTVTHQLQDTSQPHSSGTKSNENRAHSHTPSTDRTQCPNHPPLARRARGRRQRIPSIHDEIVKEHPENAGPAPNPLGKNPRARRGRRLVGVGPRHVNAITTLTAIF
jgi:hypothetical protein